MKCWSFRTLPLLPSTRATASRSKSAPLVVRASHPRPTNTLVRPGAALVRLTLAPLDNETDILIPNQTRMGQRAAQRPHRQFRGHAPGSPSAPPPTLQN